MGDAMKGGEASEEYEQRVQWDERQPWAEGKGGGGKGGRRYLYEWETEGRGGKRGEGEGEGGGYKMPLSNLTLQASGAHARGTGGGRTRHASTEANVNHPQIGPNIRLDRLPLPSILSLSQSARSIKLQNGICSSGETSEVRPDDYSARSTRRNTAYDRTLRR